MYCPKIWPDFVDSASRTVPISTCTVQKLACYVPVVSSILISYCPNSNLYIPTFQLNFFENSYVRFKTNTWLCWILILYCPIFDLYCLKIVSYWPNFDLFVPKIQLFLLKSHHVLSNNFTWFCPIDDLYCPNFDLYCPKIDLNFLKNFEWSFC